MTILKLQNIKKSFFIAKKEFSIIENATFSLEEKEKISFIGPSGCGKTTLLQICGLLDNPTSGDIFIDSKHISKANDKEKTKLRKDFLGFVYQFHNLMPEFSAIENIMIPLLIKNISKEEAYKEAEKILKHLNLIEKANSKTFELSGGEQQRIAIGRAIVGKPKLILADEPTGNLDPDNADNIFKLLLEIVDDFNLSLLIVTHNIKLAEKTEKIYTIRNKIIEKL